MAIHIELHVMHSFGTLNRLVLGHNILQQLIHYDLGLEYAY